MFNADIADPIDENLYGTHPIYLDTRYYHRDSTGELRYVPAATNRSETYTSYTHGVFMRNAHPLEVLLRDESLTWRGLGGTVDMYFYSGPTAKDVMTSYQASTVGFPAMQQYWTLGFHQCRWGYTGWRDLQRVVDELAKADIPLETIWGKPASAEIPKRFDAY
jgi:alpha-glucosidase